MKSHLPFMPYSAKGLIIRLEATHLYPSIFVVGIWVPAELKLHLVIEIEFCKTQIAVYLPQTFMGCIPMCL
jgi:hypothetical protein